MKKDFEEIEDAYTRVSIAEWTKFCSDFDIAKQYNLSSKEIVDIFKKSSFAHTPLTFEHFQTAIEKIAIMGKDKQIQADEKAIVQNQKLLIKIQKQIK